MYEDYYLNQFLWKDRIVKLSGTVEERLKTIKDTLEFYIPTLKN